jgi:hypothetical protein
MDVLSTAMTAFKNNSQACVLFFFLDLAASF